MLNLRPLAISIFLKSGIKPQLNSNLEFQSQNLKLKTQNSHLPAAPATIAIRLARVSDP
jgi:hypothetical protein